MSNSEIDIIKTTVDKISVKLSKVSSIIQTHEITLAGVKKFEETFWKRYDDLKKKTEESEKLARYAAEGFREYTSAFNNMKSSFNILEENQEEFKTDFIKFKKDITFVINENNIKTLEKFSKIQNRIITAFISSVSVIGIIIGVISWITR